MESTRITLARVLELGVRVSWREAAAIVHEAVAGTGVTEGAGPARVTAESCLLTRGGDVVLAGTAAQARAEAVVGLLDDLLTSCSDPGRFAGAVADGTALEMIDELSQHTTPRRRRVEVASVALRGLAAAADAARAMADARQQDPAADVDGLIAAPMPTASATVLPRPRVAVPAPLPAIPMVPDRTVARRGDSAFGIAKVGKPGLDRENPIAAVEAARTWTARGNAVGALAIGTSPAQGRHPSATQWPASFSGDVPSAKPRVNAVRTAKAVRGGYASPFDWVKRASLAALVCTVLVVAAGGILVLRMPATPRSAVAPSEPAIEPQEIDAALVSLDVQPPRARPEPAVLSEVTDPLSVPPTVARSAPRGSPGSEAARAPVTPTQDAIVPSMRPPAGRRQAPTGNTITVAESRSLSTTSAAALVPPDAANAVAAPPPAVDLSSVVASPSATASSPAETSGSTSTDAPANAVARSPGREAEARAIENVLGRYRTAFNQLDAGAAVAVWPTMQEKTLAKAFERLESHDVAFESCEIEIFSVLAEAACSGSSRYVRKVGSRTPRHEARRWRFSLRKVGDGWLIDSVDAR